MTSSLQQNNICWKTDILPIVLVILAAASIRVFALKLTAVINPDGALYIDQARAVAMGEWKAALSPLSFFSSTPLLISLFHLAFPDWLIAAHAVSVVFGTLAIIPLHGFLRQFFPQGESLVTTLSLAFLPTWVFNSVDVVREPVCWFFSLYGLYWLAKGLNENKKILLTLSGFAFLLAAWARIETLVYPASCLLLPLLSPRHRNTTLLWLYLPFMAGGVFVTQIPLSSTSTLLNASRLHETINNISTGVPQYSELRQIINNIRNPEQGNLLFFFLAETRKFIWLIAVGTIANRLFEAMSYPFTLIALFGSKHFLRHEKSRWIPIFFTLMIVGALLLLYTRALQTWIIEYRYLMLAILPGSLFLCAGISSLASRIEKFFQLSHLTVMVLLALILVISTLPKNLQTRGESEIPLKEIGEYLDSHHASVGHINLTTSSKISRVVDFYANRTRHKSQITTESERVYSSVIGTTGSIDELIVNLRNKAIDYLLWEENNRPKDWPNTLDKNGGLEEMGRWQHHQAGTIILYRVVSARGV